MTIAKVTASDTFSKESYQELVVKILNIFGISGSFITSLITYGAASIFSDGETNKSIDSIPMPYFAKIYLAYMDDFNEISSLVDSAKTSSLFAKNTDFLSDFDRLDFFQKIMQATLGFAESPSIDRDSLVKKCIEDYKKKLRTVQKDINTPGLCGSKHPLPSIVGVKPQPPRDSENIGQLKKVMFSKIRMLVETSNKIPSGLKTLINVCISGASSLGILGQHIDAFLSVFTKEERMAFINLHNLSEFSAKETAPQTGVALRDFNDWVSCPADREIFNAAFYWVKCALNLEGDALYVEMFQGAGMRAMRMELLNAEIALRSIRKKHPNATDEQKADFLMNYIKSSHDICLRFLSESFSVYQDCEVFNSGYRAYCAEMEAILNSTEKNDVFDSYIVIIYVDDLEKLSIKYVSDVSENHGNIPVLIRQNGEFSLYGRSDQGWKITRLKSLDTMSNVFPENKIGSIIVTKDIATVVQPVLLTAHTPVVSPIKRAVEASRSHAKVFQRCATPDDEYNFPLNEVRSEEEVEYENLLKLIKGGDAEGLLLFVSSSLNSNVWDRIPFYIFFDKDSNIGRDKMDEMLSILLIFAPELKNKKITISSLLSCDYVAAARNFDLTSDVWHKRALILSNETPFNWLSKCSQDDEIDEELKTKYEDLYKSVMAKNPPGSSEKISPVPDIDEGDAFSKEFNSLGRPGGSPAASDGSSEVEFFESRSSFSGGSSSLSAAHSVADEGSLKNHRGFASIDASSSWGGGRNSPLHSISSISLSASQEGSPVSIFNVMPIQQTGVDPEKSIAESVSAVNSLPCATAREADLTEAVLKNRNSFVSNKKQPSISAFDEDEEDMFAILGAQHPRIFPPAKSKAIEGAARARSKSDVEIVYQDMSVIMKSSTAPPSSNQTADMQAIRSPSPTIPVGILMVFALVFVVPWVILRGVAVMAEWLFDASLNTQMQEVESRFGRAWRQEEPNNGGLSDRLATPALVENTPVQVEQQIKTSNTLNITEVRPDRCRNL